jgi:CubicO group peptidase (beta-lactamase class C family)
MKSPMQWSCTGYSVGGGKLFGKSSKAFGHTGWGGSMAFGDPESRLSFAYTMNLLTGSMLGDQRALKLVETTYKNL